MPKNRKEEIIYALLTVCVTVCAFVFYSIYVINGNTLMTINNTDSVINAIKIQGGIYLLGKMVSLPVVLIIEFILAISSELLIGGPLSFKIANKLFDFKTTNKTIIELSIICSTVFIMCPLMSFFANILYYPYYTGFNILTFIASYLKLICLNFPFAFFSQIFFIQPIIRKVFKLIFMNK